MVVFIIFSDLNSVLSMQHPVYDGLKIHGWLYLPCVGSFRLFLKTEASLKFPIISWILSSLTVDMNLHILDCF
uniref:Ovule protein n=1 Tax=Heterorhabditis bacteriophora TaxID=37862 RepID=A0A1I7WHG3_HETBA